MDSKDKRKYPCPKCDTGELYDDGGMFFADIKCDNPKCNYTDDSDMSGCIGGDIGD